MSKPLTEEQFNLVAGCAWNTDVGNAISATLRRLRYLERKVVAADRIANEVREGYGVRAGRFAVDYDEVAE